MRRDEDRWWVEYEIKTILEKERVLRKEKGKLVYSLIPLNLDGYMFTDQRDLGGFGQRNQLASRSGFPRLGEAQQQLSKNKLTE